MSREKELAKNTFIIFLGTLLPKATTLITLPILTGYLTKAEYGVFDLINTLTALLIPLLTMKLEMAAFRFLLDSRQDKEKSGSIISSSLLFVLMISSVAVLIIFLSLKICSYSTLLSLIIAAYFFLDNLYTLLQQIARGVGRNLIFSVSAIVNAVINMLMIVALVWWRKYGLTGLMISLDCALLISTALLFFALGIPCFIVKKRFSTDLLKQMFSYSWPLVPNSLSSWVMSLSDRLIVTAILGIEVNAVYSVANKIPSLFNTMQGSFIAAWHENASLSVDDSDSSDYYGKMFDNVFSVLSGIMGGLIAITPLLFRILIDEKYADAYYQMPFLFGGMMCFSLSSFMGGIYTAHKQTKSVGITTVVAAAANLIINISLIHFIGLYAASISTFVSYLLLIVYRMIDVRKFQPIKYNIRKIIVCTAVIVLMCVLTFINSTVLNIVNFAIGAIFAYVLNRKLISILFKKALAKVKKVNTDKTDYKEG